MYILPNCSLINFDRHFEPRLFELSCASINFGTFLSFPSCCGTQQRDWWSCNRTSILWHRKTAGTQFQVGTPTTKRDRAVWATLAPPAFCSQQLTHSLIHPSMNSSKSKKQKIISSIHQSHATSQLPPPYNIPQHSSSEHSYQF
jgi:hypothetical protein